MWVKWRTKVITKEAHKAADAQIKAQQKQINYDTKDFTLELVVDKFRNEEIFVPDYQRKFICRKANRSSFVGSVLLGLPIPFMFFADCEDGRLEIIDGAQRVQTLVEFFSNQLVLSHLPKLPSLEGFRYSNLSEAQRRRLKNRTLRIVVLEEATPSTIRQDIFNRVNTSGLKANPSEIRRGSFPGPLTDFIDLCSKNKLFETLCPVPVFGSG